MSFATTLQKRMEFIDKVDAVRQTYYIFKSEDGYLVFSLSATKKGSGNFNLVSGTAVEYVYERFSGERNVTSTDVVARARRTKHVPNSLVALNILYVLVAQKRASIQAVGLHSKLYFTILSPGSRARLLRKRGKKKPARHRVRKRVVR